MILRDPVHGLVCFESEELRIVVELLKCVELQRLRKIRQLGLASFAYPGADHTRFSHAIGAAHVMTRFIARLRELHHVVPFWQRLSTDRARDAVVAALLHDIGHGPFSHLFEMAWPDSPSHETWTERLILDPDSEVHRVLSNQDPGLPQRTVDLIHGRHPIRFLTHTVSGTFDVDRCDYLLRDAHFTGVSYGKFDLDWLLRSLCIDSEAIESGEDNSNEAPPLAIDGAKGVPAIESFIMARFFMFQQVYFHKASRSAEKMILAVLRRARQLIQDDYQLPYLPAALRAPALGREMTRHEYLSLDDAQLWASIESWQHVSDPVLSDLCSRLCSRRLLKTIELYPEEFDSQSLAVWEGLLREEARKAGFDPDFYVGIDQVSITPYSRSKDSLRVRFPRGTSRSPEQVSLILNRLSDQQLERTRLFFPEQLRDAARAIIQKV